MIRRARELVSCRLLACHYGPRQYSSKRTTPENLAIFSMFPPPFYSSKSIFCLGIGVVIWGIAIRKITSKNLRHIFTFVKILFRIFLPQCRFFNLQFQYFALFLFPYLTALLLFLLFIADWRLVVLLLLFIADWRLVIFLNNAVFSQWPR
jgi:hypothetical protein